MGNKPSRNQRRHERRVRQDKRRNDERPLQIVMGGLAVLALGGLRLGVVKGADATDKGFQDLGSFIKTWAGPREVNLQNAYDDGTVVTKGLNKPAYGKAGTYILHLTKSDSASSDSVVAVSCDGPGNVLLRDVTPEGNREAQPDSTWSGPSPACINGVLRPDLLNENGNTILLRLTTTK